MAPALSRSSRSVLPSSPSRADGAAPWIVAAIWALFGVAVVAGGALAPYASPSGKLFVAALGVVLALLPLVGVARWQPCALAAAVAYLGYYGTVTYWTWFPEGPDWRTFRSLVGTRIAMTLLQVRQGSYVGAATYFMEQSLMPVVQLVIAGSALARWRR